MKAALLDRNGNVIGEVFDAPETGYSVDIAECFTASGDPINVKSYRISRSKKNMAKAEFEQPITKIGDVWTFRCVEDDQVVY